jgi:hypothetical protein
MKKIILYILFINFCNPTKAQSYAIINDKDGFVNVKKAPNVKAAIVGKIHIDEIFGLEDDDENKSEWLKIYKQNEAKHGLEGYIHKSRIFLISNFKTAKKTRVYADSCVSSNDSLTIIAKSGIFKSKNHKFSYAPSGAIRKEDPQTELDKIDGKQFWGTDGEIPKKAITSLKIMINGSQINIPKSAFDDLYEPRLKTLKVYLGINNTLYIEMDNSDGAGAYSVIWIIKNNQYLKRYIDNINA